MQNQPKKDMGSIFSVNCRIRCFTGVHQGKLATILHVGENHLTVRFDDNRLPVQFLHKGDAEILTEDHKNLAMETEFKPVDTKCKYQDCEALPPLLEHLAITSSIAIKEYMDKGFASNHTKQLFMETMEKYLNHAKK